MTGRGMTRGEALLLVRRLLEGDYADDSEGDALVDELERGLACPRVGDYLYCDRGPEVTADEVVDRALAYRQTPGDGHPAGRA
ncbi:e9imm peptide [Streptomyces atacamensis]|uniref:e9imm peptide n=1 Tax=Streptomyces atacamensis TaxID=531966 RepID=UPI00399C608F